MTKTWFSITLGAVLLVWALRQSAPLDDYVRQARTGDAGSLPYSAAVSERVSDTPMAAGLPARETSAEETELRSRIAAGAEERRIAPIDAKMDPVWKAIPGYNGLEVDVEKTYQLARASGKAEKIPWVYREVPPARQLDDLGAQPIYKGNPNKPMASLMINVAWGNEFIAPMLAVLEKEQVKATFFFDGSWLSKNAETAKTIAAAGHELSNHAYSHKDMSKLSDAAAREEIVKTQTLLKETLNVDNRLFAPPSGDYNMNTVRVAHELGLRTVMWTIDTVDWKNPEPGWIIQKISSRLEPGSMILMHPTKSSSAALSDLIQVIKQRGLTLGTVSELLSSSRVPTNEMNSAIE